MDEEGITDPTPNQPKTYTLACNYARAVYDANYNKNGKYAWDIILMHYNDDNNYDSYVYFSIYTEKQSALTGSYNWTDMDYAGMILVYGADTNLVKFVTCDADIKFIRYANNRYEYKIDFEATDVSGNKYIVTGTFAVFCWDYNTQQIIEMTDEIGTGWQNVLDEPYYVANNTLIVNQQGWLMICNMSGQVLYSNYVVAHTEIADLPHDQVLVVRLNNKIDKIKL